MYRSTKKELIYLVKGSGVALAGVLCIGSLGTFGSHTREIDSFNYNGIPGRLMLKDNNIGFDRCWIEIPNLEGISKIITDDGREISTPIDGTCKIIHPDKREEHFPKFSSIF
jgi:hypothetical protein